jgi:crossover junction endodeoxyribonuclease RuvC
MRVIGFDPGTATTGYGVVEREGSRLRYHAHGVITTPAHAPFAERLVTIHAETAALLSKYRPDGAAIEKLYFTKNITTGIAVAQARGVIALAIAQAGLPIGEFSPLEVKGAVVGYGKATKRQVQEMLKVLLNLEAPPSPDDAADALAVAICQLNAGAFHKAIEGSRRA